MESSESRGGDFLVDMAKVKARSLNSGEAKALKACVYDLSENAAKQVLYGLIQILCIKVNIPLGFFQDVLDDARKYDDVKGVKR